MAVMTKARPGHHTLFAQIPDVVWRALEEEADRTGDSIAKVVTRALARQYRIKEEDLPKPKRAGRKPGPKEKP